MDDHCIIQNDVDEISLQILGAFLPSASENLVPISTTGDGNNNSEQVLLCTYLHF